MVVLIDKKEIKKIKKIKLKIIDQSVYFLSLVKYFKKSFSTSCSIMLLNNCLYSLFLLAKCILASQNSFALLTRCTNSLTATLLLI